ncbi:MAG: twin-arginine translocase subunit TatC, partial [Thaumarchaeota archaeon S14]
MPGPEHIRGHLDELRSRILRVAAIVGAVAVFAMTFHAEPFGAWGVTLYYPVPDPLDNIAAQVTAHMRHDLVPPGVQLIQTSPGQAFFAQVYVAALLALLAAMPAVARECVAFLRPALREREVRAGRAILLPSVGLFAGGCAMAYLLVIPYILEFLYRYGESAGLLTFLNVIDFVVFVLQFLLAFGISFQLPLAMYAVSASGAVDSGYWLRNARYAVIA